MENLKLTLPAPNPGTHLLVETRPDKFIKWLEELPSGNMAKFTSEVADAISYINRTEMPIAQRISLTQSGDFAYEKIHNFYRPLMKLGPHKGKHAPLNELSEVYRLTKEMSFAYKTAVYSYLGKNPFFGKNKNLANAINMSLHYLGLMLLEHYELYSPIPMHVWSEVHRLYYCAEQQGLSELSMPNNYLKSCFDNTEMTYIRICLISLSNPYRFKRGDHWEINLYLTRWSSESIISEDPDDFSKKSCFVIDLNSDDKPSMMTKLKVQNNAMVRFILTHRLVIKLNQHIATVQHTNKSLDYCFSKNVIARKATELLEDMLDSWEMKQERKAPRYPKISKMEVIWGIDNIYKVLSYKDPLIPDDLSTNNIDVKKLIELHWNTINSSLGGTCISQLKKTTQDVDVGVLVAIRQSINDKAPEKWILGIICWITGNKRSGTQLGIEYIKGEIQAVQLQARKGNNIDTGLHASLMVSGEKVLGLTTPTLLTATGLYIESRAMVMRIGEEEHFIHARTKVSSSGSVDRFFYHVETNTPVLEPEIEEDGSSDKNTEVIDLSAIPDAPRKGEINGPSEDKEKAHKVVTLDDVIVSKNK
ncbi:MAG: hypothetical protein GY808_15485 [Gammaproteobacteria bacterium]|nr:hypothetical protein [Gammaproteobacteria bacterium]